MSHDVMQPMDDRRQAALPVSTNELANWTGEQCDELFRNSNTLPIDILPNLGGHEIDVARREILNDASWKGFFSKGQPVWDFVARLEAGYVKRFWMDNGRLLGETVLVDGRIRLQHALEAFTLDQPVNDLQPGRYILLRYTDPVFENVFYDVMKAVTQDVILYRGYTGRFPNGRRGLTSPLMRRYGFEQMGVDDHTKLFGTGTPLEAEALTGSWLMDAVATTNHRTPVATLTFDPVEVGRVASRCDIAGEASDMFSGLIRDHFQRDDFTARASELRRIDDRLIAGLWWTDLRGPLATLLRRGARGLFHAGRDPHGARRFGLHYLLMPAS